MGASQWSRNASFVNPDAETPALRGRRGMAPNGDAAAPNSGPEASPKCQAKCAETSLLRRPTRLRLLGISP